MKINWQLGIGFSGAESSGKTTLVQALGDSLNVPVVLGVVRDVVKEMNLTRPPAFGTDTALTLEFQKNLFQAKSLKEKFVQAPFLADRTMVDVFAYTLSVLGREASMQEFLKDYFAMCMDYNQNMYHFHFIVPTGKFDLVDDGLRNTLPYNAYMMHYMITGLIYDMSLPHHIIQSTKLEQRLDEVTWVMYNNGFLV